MVNYQAACGPEFKSRPGHHDFLFLFPLCFFPYFYIKNSRSLFVFHQAVKLFFNQELHSLDSSISFNTFYSYFTGLCSRFSKYFHSPLPVDHELIDIISSFFSSLSTFLFNSFFPSSSANPSFLVLSSSESYILSRYFLYCSSYPITWRKHSFESLMKAWRKIHSFFNNTATGDNPVTNELLFRHARTSLHGFDQVDIFTSSSLSSESFHLNIVEFKGQLSYRNMLINVTNPRYRNSDHFLTILHQIKLYYKDHISHLLKKAKVSTNDIQDFFTYFNQLLTNRYKYTATGIGNDFLLKLSSGNFLSVLSDYMLKSKIFDISSLFTFLKLVIKYNQLIALTQNASCFNVLLKKNDLSLTCTIDKNILQRCIISISSNSNEHSFSFEDFLVKFKTDSCPDGDPLFLMYLEKKIKNTDSTTRLVHVIKEYTLSDFQKMILQPSLFLQSMNTIQNEFLMQILNYLIKNKLNDQPIITYSLELCYSGNRNNLSFISQRMNNYLIYKYDKITNLLLPKRVIFNSKRDTSAYEKIVKSFNLSKILEKSDRTIDSLLDDITNDCSYSYAFDKQFFFISLLKKRTPFIYPRLTHFENNNCSLYDTKHIIFYSTNLQLLRSDKYHISTIYYPRLAFSWGTFFDHTELNKFTMSSPFTLYKEREGLVFRLFRKPNTKKYVKSWKKLLADRNYKRSTIDLLDKYQASKGIVIRKKGKKCKQTLEILQVIITEYVTNWNIFSDWIRNHHKKGNEVKFESFVDNYFRKQFKIENNSYKFANQKFLPAVSTINNSSITYSFLFPSHNLFLLQFMISLSKDLELANNE